MIECLFWLALAPELPPAEPVTIAAPERWTVQEVSRPKSAKQPDSTKPITLKIKGRKVTIGLKGFQAVFVTPSPDGSILVQRINYDLLGSVSYAIWYEGRETQIGVGPSVYRDRLNYGGNYFKEGTASVIPDVMAYSVVVNNGKRKELGPGFLQYWGPGDTFVIENYLDKQGQPIAQQFEEGYGTAILSPFGQMDFNNYAFLSAQSDGAITLYSERKRVLRWKEGKVIGHWEMPPGWIAIGAAPGGWILARKGQILEDEVVWEMGIIRGNKLHPIQFPRPKNSRTLLWRGGREEYGDQAFRMHAFYGNTDRWYRFAKAGP